MPSSDHREAYYERYVSEFKAHEPGRDWSPDRYRAWWDEHYLPWLADEPRTARLLELGCGDGSLLRYLGELGFTNVEGVDISMEQVERARGDGLNVRLADAFTALSESQGPFRGVIAQDFLEHFTKPELVDLLRLIADSLEPGGFLLVRTPNGEGLFAGQIIYGDLTHCTVFTPASLTQALRLAGFERTSFRESLFVAHGVRGRSRHLAWRIIRAAANAIRLVQAGKRQEIWSDNLLCLARIASADVE